LELISALSLCFFFLAACKWYYSSSCHRQNYVYERPCA